MIRVIHAPTAVGGNPQGLSRYLSKLGLKSTSLSLVPNSYGYFVDIVLWRQDEPFFLREIKRWNAFWNIINHDIIHYNYGTTLFSAICSYKPAISYKEKILRSVYALYTNITQLYELEILKYLDKPVFVHYQGDDARQGDFCLNRFDFSIASQVGYNYYNIYSDAFKRKSIRRMARYCDQIYSVNPDLLHVLPEGSKFIPYCHIPVEEWAPVYNQDQSDRPLRIGHAPSNRNVKGTGLIIAALDELKSEGYSFELVLVEDVSHEEARKYYEKIDVLVDQLFAGWYGGVAVEAMALGKPVLVYIREEDLRFIPQQMSEDLPFIRVTPRTIREGLRKTLEMPREELIVLAEKSRAFVEKWHNPLKIAIELKNDYEAALHRRGKL